MVEVRKIDWRIYYNGNEVLTGTIKSSVRTIDSLANVLWESTSDNDIVCGVWERF